MLDLETLKAIPRETVFAKGKTTDDNNGVNVTNSGKPLKWIAKKGYNDWAIYIHWDSKSDYTVETQGDRVLGEKNIRKLVPCSNEVYNEYRK